MNLRWSDFLARALFGFTLGGGVLAGLVVSVIAGALHRLITAPLAKTYFTVAVMFGPYVLAESFGGSGLITVAIAGLYMGNRTMRVAMSQETRTTLTGFWEMLTFIVTSFAFLLLGLKADVILLSLSRRT